MPPKKTCRIEFPFLAPGQSRYPIIEFEEEMLIPRAQLDAEVDILSQEMLIRANAEGKVETRDMGPYGQGLMAKKPIQRHELLIYGGVYVTNATNPSRYWIKMDENLFIDSQHLMSSASFLQHLPISLPASSPDNDVATENMLLTMVYWCVRPGFYIPLAILVAKRRILPGEILGFAYDMQGLDYWPLLNMTPALFKKNGELHFQPFSVQCENVATEKTRLISNLDASFLQSSSSIGPGFFFFRENDHILLAYFPEEIQADFQIWIKAFTQNWQRTGTYFYSHTAAQIPVVRLQLKSGTNVHHIHIDQPDIPRDESETVHLIPPDNMPDYARYLRTSPYFFTLGTGGYVFKLNTLKKSPEALADIFRDHRYLNGELYRFARRPDKVDQAAALSSLGVFREERTHQTMLLDSLIDADPTCSRQMSESARAKNYNQLLLRAALGLHRCSAEIVECVLTHFSSASCELDKVAERAKAAPMVLPGGATPEEILARKQRILDYIAALSCAAQAARPS